MPRAARLRPAFRASSGRRPAILARLRGMVSGRRRFVAARDFYPYAAEAFWKEGNRREANGTAFQRIVGLAMAAETASICGE